jgi:hypothetical protein
MNPLLNLTMGPGRARYRHVDGLSEVSPCLWNPRNWDPRQQSFRADERLGQRVGMVAIGCMAGSLALGRTYIIPRPLFMLTSPKGSTHSELAGSGNP